MIEINKIQTALAGIVGFKQPYNPDYSVIDNSNTTSESGYYINDNPYAKVEYIKDSQDFVGINNRDFNLFLSDLKKSSISSICNQVFSEYDFIDRQVIYKEASNKINLETLPTDAFVGYKLEISKRENISFRINRVILDFQGSGDIEVVLYNTSVKAPIKSKTITVTEQDHIQVELNWAVNNTEGVYGGDYYLGYYTNGITLTPFKRDWAAASIINSPKEMYVTKVRVLDYNGSDMFDLSKIEGMSENIGLNPDITVCDDYTDFIINNKMLFARSIQLEGIIRCIQLYISSLRSNSNQQMSSHLYERMMLELEGTSGESVVKVSGLKNQLLGEITSIRSEVNKLRMSFNKTNQIMVSTLR